MVAVSILKWFRIKLGRRENTSICSFWRQVSFCQCIYTNTQKHRSTHTCLFWVMVYISLLIISHSENNSKATGSGQGSANACPVNKVYWNTGIPTCVRIVFGCAHATGAELSSGDSPHGLQSRKYVLFGPSQKNVWAPMVHNEAKTPNSKSNKASIVYNL